MASSCGSGVAGGICHIIPFIPIVGGWVDLGGAAAKNAVSDAGSDVLNSIAQAMASAANGLLNTLSSFWMHVDTPDMTSAGSPVAAIQANIGWITTCTAVVCILVAAGRMAIRRRGEPGTVLAMGLARLVIVSAVATFLVQAAGKLGDTFSADLMSSAHLGSTGWSGVISTTALAGAFAGGDGMLLVVALLVIFSSLIQLALMILRVGLMVILTGTLPLAAAASMSDWGQTWWRKHVSWLTAWLLYKPAAALLYAAAFTLTDGTNRSGVEVISGFMLLILSILILPALLKVMVPMTASLGAASSGTLAMGAAGAVATGAIRIAAMAGTGGASGAAQGASAADPAKAAGAAVTAGTGGKAGAAEAATSALSGNTAPAGDKASAAPDGAGLRTSAGPPSHHQFGDSERTVEHRPGSPSRGQEGAGASASVPSSAADAQSSPPAGGGSVSQPAGGVQPADGGAGQDPGERPSGSHAADLPDATGPGGPPGAVDNGDDEEREIGG
ncbi:MAG TPA: hypothetical protein VN969_07560 [Streptosporangiaceae bacterium]|nr:hypothetical protein [Streptosporangiaceae bacterium]